MKKHNGHEVVEIVRKTGDLFELRSFVNGELLETVKARTAQMILDHVRATWPPGTTIQWIVIPRAAPKPQKTIGSCLADVGGRICPPGGSSFMMRVTLICLGIAVALRLLWEFAPVRLAAFVALVLTLYGVIGLALAIVCFAMAFARRFHR